MTTSSVEAKALGDAVVRSAFPLAGRGTVLVFEPAINGEIPRNGDVVVNGRALPYRGPEYVDGTDGTCLGVIVADEDAAAAFPVGGAVSFR